MLSGQLPIKNISSSVKEFSRDLASLKLNKKDKKDEELLTLKKLLDKMLSDLNKLISGMPPFKAVAKSGKSADHKRKKSILDDQLSQNIFERQRRMSEVRDMVNEIENKEAKVEQEKVLNIVSAQGKVAVARAEQQLEDEKNCCTRTFCCYFSPTQKTIDNITREREQKNLEIQAKELALQKEKERLSLAAQHQSAIDHEKIDAIVEQDILSIQAAAAAESEDEHGYEAYKYTLSPEMMLLLIKINSCVRRIEDEMKGRREKGMDENTSLISMTKKDQVSFALKLHIDCKLMFCVNPERQRQKKYFKELYMQYHDLDKDTKKEMRKGNISQDILDRIFPVEWKINVESFSLYEPKGSGSNDISPLYERKHSFKK